MDLCTQCRLLTTKVHNPVHLAEAKIIAGAALAALAIPFTCAHASNSKD